MFKLPSGLLSVLLLACGSTPTPTRPVGNEFIEVDYPPPPAQIEEFTEELAGRPECKWLDGYYAWQGRRWEWIPGLWVVPPLACARAPGSLAWLPRDSASAVLHSALLVRDGYRPARQGPHLSPTHPMSEPTVERVMSEPEIWSIARVLRWATEDFTRRANPSSRLDAELLLCEVLGIDRIRLIVDATRPLAPAELAAYRELIQRRRRGEPIAYIRGEREFYGHRFRVDARVLVPRPDTETLVEVALDRTRARSLYGRALDLCTGSGCVAIAFAKARRTWRVTAIDVSPDALRLARENAERLGVNYCTHWLEGDLFGPLAPNARFELVVGNPPYIPRGDIAGLDRDVRDFEPHLALDGGDDGLSFVRRIVADTPGRLVPGGVLALEVGYDQAERVAAIFEERGFSDVRRRRDYGGHERVVSGVYGPP